MPWVCTPCSQGDHSSHNNGGKPWDGTSKELDAFDCKVERDRSTQCLCRMNWPEKDAPAGSCLSGDPIPGHICTDCPPERIEAELGRKRIAQALLSSAKGLLARAKEKDDYSIGGSLNHTELVSTVRGILYMGCIDYDDLSRKDQRSLLAHAKSLLHEA